MLIREQGGLIKVLRGAPPKQPPTRGRRREHVLGTFRTGESIPPALLDPFNAGHLHFSIIEKLATKPTMDIVVHLSTGDIQRNIAAGLEADHSPLDSFAPGWRHVVKKQSSKHAMRDAFVGHWRALVGKARMHVCDTMYPVRNSKESTMYWLCLITRHPLADKLWREACQMDTRSLF